MKNLIVISAPSGAGKTTICRELQRRIPDLRFSVSCTTRPRRSYEKDGYDYEFVTEQEFKRRIEAEELVEYEEVHGHLYGTPRSNIESAIENDETLLLELDVKGGVAIRHAYPEHTITIFIKPPSVQELKRRLRDRGSDSDERIRRRLERMELEMTYESQYAHSIFNQDLDSTIEEIISILLDEAGQSRGERHGIENDTIS